jgi:hypothetical protein
LSTDDLAWMAHPPSDAQSGLLELVHGEIQRRKIQMESPLITYCACRALCSAAKLDPPRVCLDAAVHAQADLLLTQGKVDAYLATFPWCQRVAAYWGVVDQLPVADRVRFLRDLWDVDPRPSRRLREWRRELWLCSAYPDTFMSADEREFRRELSNPLVIYRGVTAREHAPTGFAWSLDRQAADFFAYTACRAQDTARHVFIAECNPDDAIAYLINADGRDDLAIFPEQLRSWWKIPIREIVETLPPSGEVQWTLDTPAPSPSSASRGS